MTIKNAKKKFDYTAIADRPRTVSLSNYIHQTGVVNQCTGPTVPLPATAVQSNSQKDTNLKKNVHKPPYIDNKVK